jgi:hypothetical protein
MPPDPVRTAALLVLHRALVFARNATLSPVTDTTMLNSLMEALHEIPDFLSHWSQHSVEEIRLHLATFRHDLWPGSPDLVRLFDSTLDTSTDVTPTI